MVLLDQLPTSAIAEIVERLSPRLYIDFIRHLPAEICLKILGYLDPISLVSVLQTCRAWYDLALDRTLWERLYHLEGWKAIRTEIEIWEARVNAGLSNSIGHLHHIQPPEGRASKIRAILNNNDDDLDMVDRDGLMSINDSIGVGSIFGSPSSSFSSNRPVIPPMSEMDLDDVSGKGKSVDRSFGSYEGRAPKRKEPGGNLEVSLPLSLPGDNAVAMVKSTLWTWDVSSSRYRINWKYLYNMRRRLESNWELGKYSSFVLPHPSYPEEGHQECVYTLQFDANYLVSGSRDRTMRIWNTHTRRLVRPPLVGHNGSVLCLQFDADPEEDILVSGSSDSNVFIWKFSTGELIQKITKAHRESVLNVRFDKRILVTSSKDKTIKIFNRRPLRYGDMGYGSHDEAVNPVATTLKRYGYEPDLAQELPVKPAYTMIGRLDGHGAAVNAIQVRDRTIVSVSGDRHIKVWDWPEQVCTQTIPAHDKGIACVEFDERRIVSGSSDYEVCIFDAPTGLKVASLRGHAHLVRTVQAGFGDLPYSKIEDEAEAKAVDAEYFKAVEAGEIDHETERRYRRGRRANAGSSRPADLLAFGAKVPPGGGGGRKYGRIVSGSYDQSIIIWRRDKEGVWKPAHHLRQEEAAEAALRRHSLTLRPILSPSQEATPSSSRSMLMPSQPATQQQQPLPSFGASFNASSAQDSQGGNQQSSRLYMALIDQVVPLGVGALTAALANYPAMLVHHQYLQGVIEREPSPFLRSQMRQAVADTVMSIHNTQSARQRITSTSASHASGSATTANTRPSRSSAAAHASSSTSVPSASAGAGASSSSANLNDASASNQHHTHQSSHSNGQGSGSAQHPILPPINLTLAGQNGLASAPHLQGGPPVATPQGTQVVGPPFQPLQLSQLPGGDGSQGPHGQVAQHHPHFTAMENAPARVFKLQFDVRKIVCCTQAAVIVGWDFCNGEAQLEEASRFFATID